MSQAYCVKCRKMVEIQNPKTILLKNKSLAMTGTCPTSGTKVFRFVKRHIDPIGALQIAIEREKEAQLFYREAAKNTKDKNGKKLLEFLADEEVWHQTGLEKQLKSMMSSSTWQEWQEGSAPISKNDLAETAETAHTREATSYEHVTGDERSAVRTALRAEMKAIRFYKDFAEAVTDPNGKKTFESLIKQEEGHATILMSVMDMVKEHKRYPLLPRFIV
ncbi:ferritin family protein [Chloroflexota bacterium]